MRLGKRVKSRYFSSTCWQPVDELEDEAGETGGIAILFLSVLAAGRIELEDEAGETGGIAILFVSVLAAGRIELEDEAGETGGIAVLFLNVLAGLSGAILTGGGKLVQ
jgi:hypothetical protein